MEYLEINIEDLENERVNWQVVLAIVHSGLKGQQKETI